MGNFHFLFAISVVSFSFINNSASAQGFTYNHMDFTYTQCTTMVMQNGSWKNESINSCTYDQQGKILELNNLLYNDGVWTHSAKFDCIYSGPSMDSINITVWDTLTEDYISGGGFKYTYDSLGLLASVSMKTEMHGYSSTVLNSFTYDIQGRVIADTSFMAAMNTTVFTGYRIHSYGPGYYVRISFDEFRTIKQKDSTVQNSSGKDSIRFGFSYNSSTWQNRSKTEWTYQDGQLTEELHHFWDGDTFLPSRRRSYSYDDVSIISSGISRSTIAARGKTGRVLSLRSKSLLHFSNTEYFDMQGRRVSESKAMSRGLHFFRQR